MKKIRNIDEFNNVVNSDNLTLIKFSAEWCGPCRNLGETINSLENDFPSVNFIEIDVDCIETEEIVSDYKIRNIPVLIFMKNGLACDRCLGSIDKNTIIDKINKNII